jgi:voltage-gated potassium channel Kch
MMQLGVASLMVAMSVIMHLVGLGALVALMRRHHRRFGQNPKRLPQLIAILGAAFGLFALHTLEIWTYAILYVWIGALPDFDDALYFSTTTYTTLGYGDIVLPRTWRLVGAIESANGIILLGWSTAFFVSVINRIRLFEHDIAAKPSASEKRHDEQGSSPEA